MEIVDILDVAEDDVMFARDARGQLLVWCQHLCHVALQKPVGHDTRTS